jgi:hypothetical protein
MEQMYLSRNSDEEAMGSVFVTGYCKRKMVRAAENN